MGKCCCLRPRQTWGMCAAHREAEESFFLHCNAMFYVCASSMSKYIFSGGKKKKGNTTTNLFNLVVCL